MAGGVCLVRGFSYLVCLSTLPTTKKFPQVQEPAGIFFSGNVN